MTTKFPKHGHLYHFGMKDDSLFAFAGIWDQWSTPQKQIIESCAILTTAENKLLRDVHDRMPLILRVEKYQEWLDTPAPQSSRLRYLLVPFEAAMMKRFPVGSAVNDPQNDTPECIQEVSEFISAQSELL